MSPTTLLTARNRERNQVGLGNLSGTRHPGCSFAVHPPQQLRLLHRMQPPPRWDRIGRWIIRMDNVVKSTPLPTSQLLLMPSHISGTSIHGRTFLYRKTRLMVRIIPILWSIRPRTTTHTLSPMKQSFGPDTESQILGSIRKRNRWVLGSVLAWGYRYF